ncbi:hypothetical protein [Neomegalonema perideroedes]|uniref:hypothetical protein n=1 Tax=Neomegalonema perideroedes TaxID=217219 RepID=UPI00037FD2D0|nr:hypothetical protein [Neomegalonema perideroedes]
MTQPLFIRRACFRFAALLLASGCAATSVQAQEGLIQKFEAMNRRIAELEAKQAQEAQISAQRIGHLEEQLAAAQNSLGRLKIVHQTGWLAPQRLPGRLHNLSQPVDSTFCYLTGVVGEFAGFAELAEILAKDGLWHVRVSSHRPYVQFKVSCVGLPVQDPSG